MVNFVVYIKKDEERQKIKKLINEIKAITIQKTNEQIETAEVIIKALEYYLSYLKQQ